MLLLLVPVFGEPGMEGGGARAAARHRPSTRPWTACSTLAPLAACCCCCPSCCVPLVKVTAAPAATTVASAAAAAKQGVAALLLPDAASACAPSTCWPAPPDRDDVADAAADAMLRPWAAHSKP